ncbi:MAG: response regulator, partial [Clostridia bacterium]|nr:response regulator [Clostridia bacterium]
MENRILVVDDEKPIVDILKINLEKNGYKVICAYDGEMAVEKAFSEEPDLILLDVMLPKTDGFSVCKKIREKSSVPIIMLTAREEEVDKVLGLELGADDYMTKPFSLRELMARVKANLRRSQTALSTDAGNDIMTFGDLTIDTEKYEVR